VRASLSAGALVLLTLAGHTAGSGSLPGPIGLVMVTILAFGLAYATGSRRLAPLQLLAFLLGAQVLLHLVLASAAGHAHGAVAGPGTAAMIAGHVAAAVVAAVLLDQSDQLIDRWASLWASALGATPHVSLTEHKPNRIANAPVAPFLCHSAHLQHHVVRRGPPASAVLACS
jgi:hypothetical protein